jgi:hypothetical protein
MPFQSGTSSLLAFESSGVGFVITDCVIWPAATATVNSMIAINFFIFQSPGVGKKKGKA